MSKECEDSCYFCGRALDPGEERLVLLKKDICSYCEKVLVNTSVDQERYLLFKEKIKQLWFN